jgi:hypothetical protein
MISLLVFTGQTLADRHPELITGETTGHQRGDHRPPPGQ